MRGAAGLEARLEGILASAQVLADRGEQLVGECLAGRAVALESAAEAGKVGRPLRLAARQGTPSFRRADIGFTTESLVAAGIDVGAAYAQDPLKRAIGGLFR